MDETLIFRKMESLGGCVDRIRSKRGFTHEELLHDYDLQDILSVNLQRAVQLSVDISPSTCSQIYPESFWTRWAGLHRAA